jgi:hypothetical protein
MAISLTWRNLFTLTGLVVLVLAALGGAVSTAVQWQLNEIGLRLNDRLSIYHRDQENIQRELDRMESRLNKLEYQSK